MKDRYGIRHVHVAAGLREYLYVYVLHANTRLRGHRRQHG
jgi:hypothetical protein